MLDSSTLRRWIRRLAALGLCGAALAAGVAALLPSSPPIRLSYLGDSTAETDLTFKTFVDTLKKYRPAG